MPGRTSTIAALCAAGLLAVALPATSGHAKVEIQRGEPVATPVSVTARADGTGVTIARGSASFAPMKTAPAEPVIFISGQRIHVDALEPLGASSDGGWFLDRSGDRLVLVHCYTRAPLLVGAGRRIFCDARAF